MTKRILFCLVAIVVIGLGLGLKQTLYAVTATYNATVRIVDSVGNVIGGTASAVTAPYNSTVQVVDSTGHVIDSFGGATPAALPTCTPVAANFITGISGSSCSYATPAAVPTGAGDWTGPITANVVSGGTHLGAGTVPSSALANNPSFTVNALPVVVSSSISPGGTGTSDTVTAPSSITNGNALWAGCMVSGTSSENFTPPAGFNQIGTTITQVANGNKIVMAQWCKVAASESGNYAFSWDVSTGTGKKCAMLNISGTTCTNDGIAQNSGVTQQTVVTGFTPTSTNDLLVAFAGVSQTGSFGAGIGSPGTFTQQQGPPPALTNTLVATAPNISGATGNFTFQFSANNGQNIARDNGAFVTAFAPSLTSAQAPVNQGGPFTTSQAVNLKGPAVSSGTIAADHFLVPNINGTSGTAGYYCLENDLITPTNILNCSGNAIVFDIPHFAGHVSIGGGGFTQSQDQLYLEPSGLLSISSPNGEQDIPIWAGDANNDNMFGWDHRAFPAYAADNENDNHIGTQKGRSTYLAENSADFVRFHNSTVSTNLTPASTPTGITVVPTGGAATQYCYRAACVSNGLVNAYVTLPEAEVCDAAGPTTLDGTHFETVGVTWPQAGCDHIRFYGRATGAELKMTDCPGGTDCVALINNGADTMAVGPISMKDVGDISPSGALPTTNDTGIFDITGGPLRLPPAHLAAFPACDVTTEGSYGTQDDSAVACVATITAVAGGSTHCQMYCNGTNWVRTGL